FEYFRDLSLDARLLIATCLYENLAGEKNSYTTFYDRLPFLKKGLPKNQLDEAIVEINGYSSGLSAYKEAGAFKISISDNARLFFEAARHIPLIKDFKALYEFTSAPDQEKAHQVADTFTRITQSGLDPRESLKKQTDKHKDKFYVNKLTIQGLKALKMPLTTFIVIPLKPWQKEEHEEVFHGLYIDFQEFNRKSGEAPIFYTLIFDLYGVDRGKIKEDIEGLDRISIIDAVMMKNIIMAESPQGKASRYIFEQLSIRERSPYTTSGAVPDSLFFGREMEIALIRGLPENIGVFGTRTIGKTSLLRKLHKAFQSHKQWKVYDMDCGRIETEEALLKNLAEKMGISFKAIPDMDRFRRYVTREAEKKGHRYLFLLDEVDRLVEYDMHHDEKIFNTFNRLCNETLKNNESAARFILFGFQQMFEQMKNPLSRLYNFMVFLPLQALDMEGAMALVTRPIENILVRWKNKEDAAYLVDSCSRHPRLLQAACHALLNNLDKKKIERNIITRPDVDMALNSQGFRDICMRLYRDPDERRTVNKIMTLFARLRGKNVKKGMRNEHTPVPNKGKEFLSDLHRITILAAVRLFFEEKKEVFTIVDIQEELKKNGIDVSPNIMRNILDRLCLSGNFRLREESTIIAKKGTKVLDETEKINISDTGATKSHLAVTVDHPDVYGEKDKTIHRFTFEFGVKVFPQLLVAHFGGLKQCERERQKLTEKGAWKKWLGRY
ncbi:MAG: ATP-binding protein, partial [Candidatus Aminicenantes bacterium]|nr:ATP-binding protein [Candidatus Aminicenantes bacterium]